MRAFKTLAHGKEVVLVENPDWTAVMAMVRASGEERFVRFALYDGVLVAGPGNVATHGAICQAYCDLVSRDEHSLRSAALGLFYIDEEDRVVLDVQFAKIHPTGLELADQTLKLESAFRRLFRGCNRPLAWIKRGGGWKEDLVVQDDPTTLKDHPKLLPRALSADEIRIVDSYWERLRAARDMVRLEADLAEGEDHPDEATLRLIEDGFLRWQRCAGRKGRSALRIFPGPLAVTLRYLLRTRPEKAADPAIDVG